MKAVEGRPKASSRVRAWHAALITLNLAGCAVAAWCYVQALWLAGDVAFCVAMAATVMRVASHMAQHAASAAEEN